MIRLLFLLPLFSCGTLRRIDTSLLDIDRHLTLIQAILDQDERCWGVEDKIYRLPKDEGYP